MVKRVAERNEPETCAKCHASVLKREIPTRLGGFIGASDWDTAHYNPALGQVVRSYADGRRVAKQKGMTEIGDEPVEKLHKKYDTERKQRLEKSYDISSLTDLGAINTK